MEAKGLVNLLYIDVNNLYGWAIVQYLPHSNFKWIDPSTWTPNKINKVSFDVNTGYIFEITDNNYKKKIILNFTKLENFKNEVESKKILEFIALRAKMYSFTMKGDKEAHKIKGVEKSAQKAIKHTNFKEYLETSMKPKAENKKAILNQKCSFLSI